MDKIVFSGKKWYLSNFYEAPFEYKGIKYKCSEAAFQAQKCPAEEDKRTFSDLSGVDAKRRGGKNGPYKLSTLEMYRWDMVRLPIMKEIVMAKFKQNPDIQKMLVDTGDAEIVEGRAGFRADKFWGIDISTGEGENNLGKILMEVREELRRK